MEFGPKTADALKKVQEIKTLLEAEWPEERVKALFAAKYAYDLAKHRHFDVCNLSGEDAGNFAHWLELQQLFRQRYEEAKALYEGLNHEAHRSLVHKLDDALSGAHGAFRNEHGREGLGEAFRNLHRI